MPIAPQKSIGALNVSIPVIRLPQPDGSVLIRAGKPEVVAPEVSIAQFSQAAGISKRHVATLCEQGMIKHRRLTPVPRSKILIPRTELSRFRKLEGEI